MKEYALALWLLFFSINLSASEQHPKIDSLKTVLNSTSSTIEKVNLLNAIALKYVHVKYDSIKTNAEKALQLAQIENYDLGVADAKKNLAIYYYFDGNREKSLNYINQAITTYKREKDTIRIAKGYNNLANLYKNFGLFKESLRTYDTAIYFNKKAKHNQGLFNNHYSIGSVYLKKGDLDLALKSYKEAEKINETLNDKGSNASVFSGFGLVYLEKGKFDSATVLLNKSLKIFKEIGKIRDAIAMANNLADIARKKGDYLNSIRYFEEALVSAQKIDNPRIEAILLLNLANNYLELNNDDKALSLYHKSANIINGIDDFVYAAALSNIALVLQEKDPEESLCYLKASNTVYRRMNSKSKLANNLNNQGANQYILGDFQGSKNTYLKAKALLKDLDLDYLASSTFLGLSKTSLALNQLDSAYIYGNEAIGLARKTQGLSEESEAAKLLYLIQKKKQNPSQALKYLELHNTLSDSLFNKDKSRELGKLEAELDFKNLKQTLELERENEKQQNEIILDSRKNLIISLVVIVIGLLLIIILLFVIKNNKTEANNRLQKISDEVLQKNEKLEKLHVQKNRLISIISHDFKGPLINLSQVIELYIDKTISKEEFDEWLPEIKLKIQSTYTLIDNLLKWAKQSLNELKIRKENINIYQSILEILDSHSTVIKEKEIQINNALKESDHIFIDKNTLDLVLRNLMSNAIKFCQQKDQIFLTYDKGEKYSLFCIEDTGVGMSSKTAKNLFKSDDIIAAVGTDNEEGSGIGAVLSKSFLEENGGSIWVESSTPGKGSKICFKVPVKSN